MTTAPPRRLSLAATLEGGVGPMPISIIMVSAGDRRIGTDSALRTRVRSITTGRVLDESFKLQTLLAAVCEAFEAEN
jgi:hypothetical protein